MHWRFRIGRSLAHWLVPPGIQALGRRGRDARRVSRFLAAHRDVLLPNAELRGRHAGRRCFVLGNGPSLARQDLAPLAGEVTLAVNAFWKHPVVERWSPTYYCFADHNFFDGSEATRRFFGELRARCPSSTFVLPLEFRPVVVERGLLPAGQTRYVASYGGELHEEGLPGPPDLVRTLPWVTNVVPLAIMVAMYAGCSPIYLMGLDHDWLAHRGAFGHFFPGVTIDAHASAANHDLSRTSYGKLAATVLGLWRSYEALRAVAEQTGTQILNATDGGFLDVFPRVAYADVVRAAEAPPRAQLRST